MMRSRPRRLAALALLAIAAAACTKTLDTEGLQDQLATQIEDQTQTEISNVDCPGDVEVAEGETFVCTVEQEDGTMYPVEVTQLDDQGRVEWAVTAPEGVGGATGATGATGGTGA